MTLSAEPPLDVKAYQLTKFHKFCTCHIGWLRPNDTLATPDIFGYPLGTTVVLAS